MALDMGGFASSGLPSFTDLYGRGNQGANVGQPMPPSTVAGAPQHLFWYNLPGSGYCFAITSDGGLIINQRTGATYSYPLDIRFNNTRVVGISTNSLDVTGSINFQAVANILNFGGNAALGATANTLESNNGTVGTYRDFKARTFISTGTGSWIGLPNMTVAQLPAAATAGAGATAFVIDSTTTLALGLGLAVVGGGANKVPVYCDGANWIIG